MELSKCTQIQHILFKALLQLLLVVFQIHHSFMSQFQISFELSFGSLHIQTDFLLLFQRSFELICASQSATGLKAAYYHFQWNRGVMTPPSHFLFWCWCLTQEWSHTLDVSFRQVGQIPSYLIWFSLIFRPSLFVQGTESVVRNCQCPNYIFCSCEFARVQVK